MGKIMLLPADCGQDCEHCEAHKQGMCLLAVELPGLDDEDGAYV